MIRQNVIVTNYRISLQIFSSFKNMEAILYNLPVRGAISDVSHHGLKASIIVKVKELFVREISHELFAQKNITFICIYKIVCSYFIASFNSFACEALFVSLSLRI